MPCLYLNILLRNQSLLTYVKFSHVNIKRQLAFSQMPPKTTERLPFDLAWFGIVTLGNRSQTDRYIRFLTAAQYFITTPICRPLWLQTATVRQRVLHMLQKGGGGGVHTFVILFFGNLQRTHQRLLWHLPWAKDVPRLALVYFHKKYISSRDRNVIELADGS